MADAEADRLVVAFARLLRRLGVEVPVGATVTLGQAGAAVGLDAPEDLYWAGRAVLLRRREDAPLYDRAFRAFWRGEGDAAEAAATVSASVGLDDGEGGDDTSADDADLALRVR